MTEKGAEEQVLAMERLQNMAPNVSLCMGLI